MATHARAPALQGTAPDVETARDGDVIVLRLTGDWTMAHGAAADAAAARLAETARKGASVIDFGRIGRIDTLGAMLIRRGAEEAGGVALRRASPEQLALLEAAAPPERRASPRATGSVMDVLEDIGRGMHGAGRDVVSGVSFLGAVVAAIGRLMRHPRSFRPAAFVKQLEVIGFRSVPIIALISLLVGGIVAQQSVFQLRTFGTTAFVADLLGILVLRELGVLLTAIMIAGRSGSAITAEIGSMKMREEIDALRTMGLDPMEVLIVPRILALIVALPLLTFVANMAGLFGGGLVAWLYGDVSPDVFLSRLRNAIGVNTFMVGMIKAPVMALVIGLIASVEGLAVRGSAESLGRQTTASVVKAIFVVIVVDGLFAMFFAAISY